MNGTLITLTVLGVVLLGCLLRAFWEPTQLAVTHVIMEAGENCTIKSCQMEEEKTAHPFLHVLFFSDLHMDHLKLNQDHLLAEAERWTPDLILFGGDVTDDPALLPAVLTLFNRLREKTGHVPLLAVPGNHDDEETLHALETAGIRVLCNSSHTLQCRGTTWQIIGLENNQRGRPDADRETTGSVAPRQRLVLTHNADDLLTFPPGQAGTFFAGHFHGGQIWLPFRLEFRLLRREKLPSLGHYKGCVRWGDMTGYINRGLGCVLIPLRFLSKPELTLIKLTSRDAATGSNNENGGPDLG